MKSTDRFKETIQAELDRRAAADPLFAVSLKKENKSIDGCVAYILGWVKESECCGFADDEIFGAAAHYYDEDSIKEGEPIQCSVVVNHKVELTAEEIAEAKKEAVSRVIAREEERLVKKSSVKPLPSSEVQQGSLF